MSSTPLFGPRMEMHVSRVEMAGVSHSHRQVIARRLNAGRRLSTTDNTVLPGRGTDPDRASYHDGASLPGHISQGVGSRHHTTGGLCNSLP